MNMNPFHVLGGCFEDIQDRIPEGTYLKMYDTLKAIKDDNSHTDLFYENQRLTSVCNRAMRQRVNLLNSIRDRDTNLEKTEESLKATQELLNKSREEYAELKDTNKRLRTDLSKLEDDTERFINPLTGRSIKSTSQLAKKLKRLKKSEDE